MLAMQLIFQCVNCAVLCLLSITLTLWYSITCVHILYRAHCTPSHHLPRRAQHAVHRSVVHLRDRGPGQEQPAQDRVQDHQPHHRYAVLVVCVCVFV